jgi:hypothetical protein
VKAIITIMKGTVTATTSTTTGTIMKDTIMMAINMNIKKITILEIVTITKNMKDITMITTMIM